MVARKGPIGQMSTEKTRPSREPARQFLRSTLLGVGQPFLDLTAVTLADTTGKPPSEMICTTSKRTFQCMSIQADASIHHATGSLQSPSGSMSHPGWIPQRTRPQLAIMKRDICIGRKGSLCSQRRRTRRGTMSRWSDQQNEGFEVGFKTGTCYRGG